MQHRNDTAPQRLLQQCRSNINCSSVAMTLVATASQRYATRPATTASQRYATRALQLHVAIAIATELTSELRRGDLWCCSVHFHPQTSVRRTTSIHKFPSVGRLPFVRLPFVGLSSVRRLSFVRLPFVGLPSVDPTVLRPAPWHPTSCCPNVIRTAPCNLVSYVLTSCVVYFPSCL
jgi:hypothetical protein